MAQYYFQFGRGSGHSETWFKGALTMAADDLLTRQAVAIWALESGRIAYAKEQTEAALRIEAADPKKYSDSNVGHTLRGLVALWENDWPDAENNFQKVIDKSPKDFVARNNLALALVEQDDPAKKQRGLDYAEANLRDNKDNRNALVTLGWAHFRRGDFEVAGVDIEQAIWAAYWNLDNDTATYWAHILHQRGQDWEAKATLESSLPPKDYGPFCMRPEALKLYEKVKDAKKPEGAPAAKTR